MPDLGTRTDDDGNTVEPDRFFGFLSTTMVAHLAFATVLAGAPLELSPGAAASPQ